MFDRATPHADDTSHRTGLDGHAPDGLDIRLVWSGPLQTECIIEPVPAMASGTKPRVDQGTLAILVERHAVQTAVADWRRLTAADIGGVSNPPHIISSAEVHHVRPAAVERPIRVLARIVAIAGSRTVVRCTVRSDGRLCAEATVAVDRITPGTRPWHVTRPPRQSLGGWSLTRARV